MVRRLAIVQRGCQGQLVVGLLTQYRTWLPRRRSGSLPGGYQGSRQGPNLRSYDIFTASPQPLLRRPETEMLSSRNISSLKNVTLNSAFVLIATEHEAASSDYHQPYGKLSEPSPSHSAPENQFRRACSVILRPFSSRCSSPEHLRRPCYDF